MGPATLTTKNNMKVAHRRTRITHNQWCSLLHKTTLYARAHISRWYWRGSLGGILPDGFDAESVASEAIAGFLRNCRQPNRLAPSQIQRDLERRVRRIINRLH